MGVHKQQETDNIMQNWEQLSVQLDAATLYEPDESIDDREIARRLANAIVDTVYQYKAQGCEVVSMEFNNGLVTLHLRQPSVGVS